MLSTIGKYLRIPLIKFCLDLLLDVTNKMDTIIIIEKFILQFFDFLSKLKNAIRTNKT